MNLIRFLILIFWLVGSNAFGQGYIPSMNIGNISLSSNTLSTTNTNGNLVIAPNGTGVLQPNYLSPNTVPYLDSYSQLQSTAALPTTLGGTGSTLATAHYFLSGPSSGSPAAPAFRALLSSDLPALNGSNVTVGTVGVAYGGTGIASGTSGGILAFTGSTTIASSGVLTANQPILGGGAGATPTSLASGVANTLLISNGASAPSWGTVNLQVTPLAGTLQIANGGTGITSGNNNGVVWLNNFVGAWQTTPTGTIGTVLTGGGLTSGVGPQWTAYGNPSQVLTSNGTTSIPTWQSVAGGGSKNYLSAYTASTSGGTANIGNGNFELGSTAGWTLGTLQVASNGLPTGTPLFASGASGNLSIGTVRSGSQIQGSYSLSYASSAATTQGNMLASGTFNIDTEDQAKVLTFKVYYQVASGASNDNFSGTSSNSFGIAAWDATNSSWIYPAGAFSMTQSSGTGYATGTFQTNSNTQQLVFIIYNANATAGATTLYFDDISVGPQTAPFGPAMTDWVAYTPTLTGFGVASGVTVYSRRNGDSLEVQGGWTNGTTTGVTAQMTLGFNGVNGDVVVDTSKVGPNTLIGQAANNFNSATQFAWAVLAPPSNQSYVQFSSQTSTTNQTTPNNGNIFAGSAATYVYFKVPIVDWSSNTSMSSDTDTRVITYFASGVPSNSISSTAQTVTIATLVDNTASVSNGVFTAPVTGYYPFSGTVSFDQTGAVTAGNNVTLSAYKNGSTLVGSQNTTFFVAGANGYQLPVTLAGGVQLNAGDTLQFKISSQQTTNVVFNSSNLSINRLSGPSVIAATESVNGLYTDTSGAAIGTSAATYTYATKVRDTHSAYSSGTLTIPVSGMYSFSATLSTTTLTMTTAQVYLVTIYRNGTQIAEGYVYGNGSASASYATTASTEYPCLTGDTITVKTYQTTAGSTTASTGAGLNNFSWARVGN
jgi:hypothetical protein